MRDLPRTVSTYLHCTVACQSLARVTGQAFSCGRCGGGLSCRACLGDWERASGGTCVTCRFVGTLTEPAYRLLCGEELQRLHLLARVARMGGDDEEEEDEGDD